MGVNTRNYTHILNIYTHTQNTHIDTAIHTYDYFNPNKSALNELTFLIRFTDK